MPSDMDSRPAVTVGWAWMGEREKLVSTIVRAPASLASRVAETVSCVDPVWLIVRTVTSGLHREALIACTWLSVTARASMPILSIR